MTIDRFFVRTATINHPTTATGYGDATTLDYEHGRTETVQCWLHQLSETEQQGTTRDADITTHVARFPVGTTIGSTDRVTIDGQTFDVDGPPSKNWTTAGEHHIRVSLRYTDG